MHRGSCARLRPNDIEFSGERKRVRRNEGLGRAPHRLEVPKRQVVGRTGSPSRKARYLGFVEPKRSGSQPGIRLPIRIS
jgi:hypothetical protein